MKRETFDYIFKISVILSMIGFIFFILDLFKITPIGSPLAYLGSLVWSVHILWLVRFFIKVEDEKENKNE